MQCIGLDIWKYIFSFLSDEDWARAKRSCRYLNSTCTAEITLKRKTANQIDFIIEGETVTLKRVSVKSFKGVNVGFELNDMSDTFEYVFEDIIDAFKKEFKPVTTIYTPPKNGNKNVKFDLLMYEYSYGTTHDLFCTLKSNSIGKSKTVFCSNIGFGNRDFVNLVDYIVIRRNSPNLKTFYGFKPIADIMSSGHFSKLCYTASMNGGFLVIDIKKRRVLFFSVENDKDGYERQPLKKMKIENKKFGD